MTKTEDLFLGQTIKSCLYKIKGKSGPAEINPKATMK